MALRAEALPLIYGGFISAVGDQILLWTPWAFLFFARFGFGFAASDALCIWVYVRILVVACVCACFDQESLQSHPPASFWDRIRFDEGDLQPGWDSRWDQSKARCRGGPRLDPGGIGG